MDPLRSHYNKKQEGAKADHAIMLFGKQITHVPTKDLEKIKEELSPRGVDEKGLSFATSSDEDEDLNPCVEVAYDDDDATMMHVGQSASFVMGDVLASDKPRKQATKPKRSESKYVAQDEDAEKPKSNVTARMEGGDKYAGNQKGGIWSRCPRCDSTDTKFCYFNNYNVNQPRHFCKHCQRYWTAGGTLRNVPIGSGKRKNKHTPMPSIPPCIQSQATSSNIMHPHTPKLITLQSRLSQSNHPHLAAEYSKLSQIYPDLACRPSTLKPVHPELAVGYSKLSQLWPDSASGSPELRQKNPLLQNGCSKSGQICPHFRSGSSRLREVCPFKQRQYPEVAKLGPSLGSRSSRLCYTCPPVQNGSCETSQECLECRRNELSGLAKSGGGFSGMHGLKENQLPISDLERVLPDLARTALERANLHNKASFMQLGYPPNEGNKCMQRCNEMKPSGCSASNDYTVHMRGECNGLLQMEAPPMCLQEGKYAQISSTLALPEPLNIDSNMKRGVEEHNSLPMGGDLWPFFYNMFWLDPLAFQHFSSILTPQGWALPCIPPNVTKIEPPSNSPYGTRAPPTCVLGDFESSSTLTTSSTTTFGDVFLHACSNATASQGKNSTMPTSTTLLGNSEDVSDGACSTITTLLGKRSLEHAYFEDHDGFGKFKTM